MAGHIIRAIVFGGISIWEIGMFYQLLCAVLIDRKNLRKCDWVIIVTSTVILGGLLAFNRYLLFFSHAILISTLVMLLPCVLLIVRNRYFLCVSLEIAYFSFVALLDFILAFLNMMIQKENFNSLVYYRGVQTDKIYIYFTVRVIIMIIIIRLQKSNVKKHIDEFRNILLGTCLIFIIMVRYYQCNMSAMVTGLTEYNGEYSMVSLAGMLVIISIIGVLVSKNKVIRKENELLNSIEVMEQQKYRELEDALNRNRELIHDTKNHYLVLKEYANAGEYKKLHQYLNEISQEMNETNPPVFTGNRVLDLLLSQNMNKAKSENIIFELQAMPLPKLIFKEREICSLFGNLLDNAVEACGRIDIGERKIVVKIEQQNQMLYIRIENTMDGEIEQKENRFVSSKENQEMHGYGLRSIQRIVDEYDGILSFEMRGKRFIANVSFFGVGIN